MTVNSHLNDYGITISPAFLEQQLKDLNHIKDLAKQYPNLSEAGQLILKSLERRENDVKAELKQITSTNKFVLHYETIPSNYLPVSLFTESLKSAETLYKKFDKVNHAELAIAGVSEGSINVEFVVESAQESLSNLNILQFTQWMQNNLAKLSSRDSKPINREIGGLLEKFAVKLVSRGYVKSVSGFIASDVQKELFRIDENNTSEFNKLVDSPDTQITEEIIEKGEERTLVGNLRGIDWDTMKCKLKTKIDNKKKKFDAVIQDLSVKDTLQVDNQTVIEAVVTPLYKISSLGEKEIKELLISKVKIV